MITRQYQHGNTNTNAMPLLTLLAPNKMMLLLACMHFIPKSVVLVNWYCLLVSMSIANYFKARRAVAPPTLGFPSQLHMAMPGLCRSQSGLAIV